MKEHTVKNSPVEIIIEPPSRFTPFNLAEIHSYSDLLKQLIWRDIAVRYKQTRIGLAWAIINPLLMTILFSIIFGMWARLPSGDMPYPLFFLAGLIHHFDN